MNTTRKTAEQVDQEVSVYRAQIDKLDARLQILDEQADQVRNSQRSYMARILMCEQERAALAKEGEGVGAPSSPAASADPLDTLTAEQVCAALYPSAWEYMRNAKSKSERNNTEQAIANAQRHLNAIRALCSPATRSGR